MSKIKIYPKALLVSIASLLMLVIPGISVTQTQAESLDRYTHNTKWCVGAGTVDKYNKLIVHRQPWLFLRYGYIEAKGYWSGDWQKIGPSEVAAQIVHKSEAKDSFTVKFNGNELRVFENGRLYRIGYRTTANRCR